MRFSRIGKKAEVFNITTPSAEDGTGAEFQAHNRDVKDSDSSGISM